MNNNRSFGIYANQSDKRWNTFIEEMNERFNLEWFGHNESGYGVDKSGSAITGSHAFVKSHVKTIITLDDYFSEGSVYRVVSKANWDELEGAGLNKKLESWDDKPTFKRGEHILVWDYEDNEDEAVVRIALSYIYGSSNPVITVDTDEEEKYLNGELFESTWYRFWKPLPKENPERQKLQQEIEQLEKELNVKRDKLKEYGKM